MSSMYIEYATAIYEDRLREAKHHRLANKVQVGRQKFTRQALGQLVSRLAKQKREHSAAVEQASAMLTNAGS